MKIAFNSQQIEVDEQLTLAEFLRLHHLLEVKGIAVAVNASVVRRKEWPVYTLSENDSVLVIKAAQGG